jgi:hypothetical protein
LVLPAPNPGGESAFASPLEADLLQHALRGQILQAGHANNARQLQVDEAAAQHRWPYLRAVTTTPRRFGTREANLHDRFTVNVVQQVKADAGAGIALDL